jgi:hypothetical protein
MDHAVFNISLVAVVTVVIVAFPVTKLENGQSTVESSTVVT